jgi:hypothetical protein
MHPSNPASYGAGLAHPDGIFDVLIVGAGLRFGAKLTLP